MVTLLPSMQFATLYNTLPDGKQIFLTTAGKLVCPHGECSSTISFWTREERKAAGSGLAPPPRGGARGRLSMCDCQNTDGLNVKLHVGSDDLPVAPPSLFEYLEQQDTEEIVTRGRVARRIPHLSGPTFLTPYGRLVCRHGASRLSLVNKQKAGVRPSVRLPACGCTVRSMSIRGGGMKNVRMGKYRKCSEKVGCVSAQESLICV